MAEIIGVIGHSGSGKSTSLRNLDHKTTYYIDADKKPLPFKGWKLKYNKENKNYCKTSDIDKIVKIIKGVSETRPEINLIIWDTINASIVDDEMKRMREKGFDKWQDLAQSIYLAFDTIREQCRDDLKVVVMCHEDSHLDEDMNRVRRIQVAGRKLQKICLESKLTTVLFTRVEGENGNNDYQFETQTNNGSTAKSPDGMFPSFLIPNDLNYVLKCVTAYENGEETPLMKIA